MDYLFDLNYKDQTGTIFENSIEDLKEKIDFCLSFIAGEKSEISTFENENYYKNAFNFTTKQPNYGFRNLFYGELVTNN